MSSCSTFARSRVPSNASMATPIDTSCGARGAPVTGAHQIAGRLPPQGPSREVDMGVRNNGRAVGVGTLRSCPDEPLVLRLHWT